MAYQLAAGLMQLGAALFLMPWVLVPVTRHGFKGVHRFMGRLCRWPCAAIPGRRHPAAFFLCDGTRCCHGHYTCPCYNRVTTMPGRPV